MEQAIGKVWRGDTRAYVLLVFAFICMALNVVTGRAVHDDIPPFGLSFWRWIVASAIFLPFTFHRVLDQWGLILANWKLLLGISAVMIPLGNSLVYLGLHTTTALNGGLIPVARPAIILVLSYFIFRGSVTRYQWMGIAVAVTGVLIVLTRGDPLMLTTLNFNQGDLWLVASSFGIATYQVLIGRVPREIHPTVLLQITMIIGMVMMAPIYAWETITYRPVELTWLTAGAVLYVATFPSIIAIYCINEGIRRIGAARMGIFNYLQPLLVASIAVPLLGEELAWYHPIALALVAFGIVLSARRRKRGAL